MTEEDELRKRAAGCLLGLAVGDALGAPFEFSKGPVDPPTPPPESFLPFGGLPAGSWTDDTQLSLITAESILECGDLDPEDLARRFADALDEIRGIGTTTRLVLEKVREGHSPHHAAEATHLELGGLSAGNGAIMRIAPVAIAFWNDLPRLSHAAHAAAGIIHHDHVAHAAAEVVAQLIALLLSGASQREQALATVEALSIDKEQRVAAALRDGATSTSAGLKPESGFVLDTLSCAVWAFIEKDSFKECVQAAVSLGGDADTNAAVTGALAGALWGIDEIPLAWREGVEASEKIVELAEKLVDFSQSRGPV